ncbi:MAG: hypothetical protein FWC76_02545 [Defluviitaleaceae bacterium]|nr:hypothetical protein [Defluviitaleaceae bacterium]
MKSYYRQFITLLQERPGYAMPGKQAVGRIVIEARDETARAIVYIQDLAPQNTYKLAFINRADETNIGVMLGSIIVDERGRYEGRFEFDRSNIGGSRIACENIDACAIIPSDSGEELAAPLVGYKGQPFSWRVNLRFPDGKEDSPILEIKEIEEAPETDGVEVVEEVVEEAIEEIVEEVVEEIVEEVVEEAMVIVAEEVPASVYDFVTEEVPIETEAQTSQNDGISTLFQSGDAVEIFDDASQVVKAQWIVTTQQNIEALGSIDNGILQSPHVQECLAKHKHALLGKKDGGDLDVYILGIPAVYDDGTNNEDLSSIFDSFKFCNPNEPMKGAHGYWLKQL